VAEYNEKLEDLLDHHLIANEELEKRKEGGGVGYLINGNMCLGIYEDLLIARIGERLATSLVDRPGIRMYLPDKGLYDDFVMVEEKVYSHTKALRKFIDQSISYTGNLPAKDHGKTQQDS
jgi:TfoX/Sxy family transcriptional regulator of competence genes